ncbi:hypothetical protein FG386_003266 [Cryptosporidium ryanae]|uniref:uncharacterized protein n=1 Tax=Cryptosporidium ryanae TaxID=515981 RepID=UPI00351A51BE|nr:hypothetical protein FG386_003266 [Cryptosporidium ryanae]
MSSNNDLEKYAVIEEENVEDAIEKYAEYFELKKTKHPSLGFPKALTRERGANDRRSPESYPSLDKEVFSFDFDSKVSETSNSPFKFKFTANDLLRLRWTNPLGEDESDFLDQKKTDGNLHSLRFNFEGFVCDNRDIDGKSKKDELHYYKGLHHHSEQGDHEGYTIPELMHLSRSSNVSQRCISIRTLGNIFLRVRQYIVIEHEKGKIYNNYLLGYLYGVQRWYKYLTEDLSIQYLLLNMLFHDSFVSRAAEYSVISLCNLFCGSFYNYHYNLTPKQHKFSVLFLFLSPPEFVFEMMNNTIDCYPHYFRNNIIHQNIDFVRKYHEHNGAINNNTDYFDLEMEEHLINFELPDGKKLELLRDILQEVYQFKPIRYDCEIESQRNSFIYFLNKMSMNKTASLDSRISSIRLISLFIQRGCINDKKLCFDKLNEMFVYIGDELFDFSSTLLGLNVNQSYNKTSDLLLCYFVFIRTYIQALYNSRNNMQINNDIHIRRRELYNLLVNSTLQIIRSVALFVLSSSLNEYENDIYSSIKLSLVEGIRIIGLMFINNIYIEDLSIYCKDLIHFLTLFRTDNPLNSYIVYHLYMLGHYIITHNSKNNYVPQEHLQFMQILNQFIPKLHNKFINTMKSGYNNLLLNLLLISISNLRFFRATIIGNTGFDTFDDEVFAIFSEYHIAIANYFSDIELTQFDSKIISIESGSLLGIELGLTSIGDILYNNECYCKYYSIILVTTYLKEVSNSLLFYNKSRYKKGIIESINSSYVNLLIDFSLEQLYKYNTQKYKKSLEDENFVEFESNKLYNYEYSYSEILSIYDNQTLVYNNKLLKNSELIQILSSNTLYILTLCLLGDNDANSFEIGLYLSKNKPLNIENKNDNYHKLDTLITIFRFNNFDFSIHFNEVKNFLFSILFNCKNIQEYAVAAYWLLTGAGRNKAGFSDFYNTLIDEYSKYIDISCGILVFNPFIYTINILFTLLKAEGDKNSVKDASSEVLFGLFKDIFTISLTNEFKNYTSKYLFEYSINQLLILSKSEDTLNTYYFGNFILTLLKLSIGFDSCDLNIDRELEDVLLDLASKKPTSDEKNQNVQNIYDLDYCEDNKYIEKLIEALITSFCNSNLFFEESILNCYYFLFVYLLWMSIKNAEIQLRLLSNERILKFLLFHKSINIDIQQIVRSNLGTNMVEKESKSDHISAKKVSDIIQNSVKLYKYEINKNTLLIFFYIYMINSNSCNFSNPEKNINFLLQELKYDN